MLCNPLFLVCASLFCTQMIPRFIMSQAESVKLLQKTVIGQTGVNATGAVIFLHGSGDNGHGVQEWVQGLMKKQFMFSHLKVIFPSAPFRPYTLYGGEPSTVWFDRLELSPEAPEHLESIDSMAESLKQIVQTEVDSGIPLNRIAIGGFSMGGAMGMQLSYRFLPQVAGVFGMSCFLNERSNVYEALERCKAVGQPVPPMYLTHGETDSLVPPSWGNATHSRLTSLGVNVAFKSLPRTEHELSVAGLKGLYSWLLERIPV